MKVLQRYFAIEIIQAVLFVLAAFLAIFSFFDLMGELPSVGKGGYKLEYAFLYVLMGLPGRMYELMPTAALIGSIYVLAQFASRSEFTIMRVSSMSTLMAGWMLARIGVLFVIITFLLGEYISPMATDWAEKLKLRVQGASISQEFRSGLWTKDVIKDNGVNGAVIGSRFVNVKEVRPDGELQDVKLYEFDRTFHLTMMTTAASAEYVGENTWRLRDVTDTRFAKTDALRPSPYGETVISTQKLPSRDLVSEITPDILSVLFADPNRMSAHDLSAYTKHLEENNQRTEAYEMAFWKKIVYPFAIFVMMALALPFAYLHFRAGGVSLKIFIGIMIGVSFQLLNSLFSHLGLLNTWPAAVTAILPSALFLLIALITLRWSERS